MRKILLVSVGSAALILSGAAMADSIAVDLGYGFGAATYDTVTKQISYACTGGDVCAASPIKGDGFLQQQIKKGTKTYMLTFIYDPSKGVFSSADAVAFSTTGSGGGSGLVHKMNITENSASQTFNTSADILTGWGFADNRGTLGTLPDNAVSYAKLGVDLKTGLSAGVATKTSLLSNFSAESLALLNDDDTVTNKLTSLTAGQSVYLDSLADKQSFTIKVQGAKTAQTNFSVPGPGVQSGTATWAVSDPVRLVWVGQSIVGVGDFKHVNIANQAAGAVNPGPAGVTDLAPVFSDTAANWGAVMTSEFGGQPGF